MEPLDHECPPTMADAAEMLWVVLANVSGGDWTKQSPEWQEAAARWRDKYFAANRQRRGLPGMGFRELARDHSLLAQRHNGLVRGVSDIAQEQKGIGELVGKLAGAHNFLVTCGVWRRLRWLVTGK